ncbi:MAG: ABC transporter permease, partial [Deltaproteobacteria bacterium]|nr:ABC transporter permease [Deltaproteobacteria bacterium]
MLIRDLSGNAVRQVSRNRRRYKVVVWFICSGIAGLISMVTIGKALQERIGRNLELIGKATIIKAGWDFEKRTRWHHREFRTEDVEELKRLAAVSGVTAFAEKPDHVFTLRERKAQGRLVAVDQHFFSTLQLGLSEGRPISDEDLIGKKHVCVVGKNLLEELCGQNGGQPRLAVCVEGVEFEVIGVLGGVEDREHERSLFI